ncbi:hypothetical protein BJV82DRAFT_552016 [Fennellomyces sp. T-0311]|nr:hypothetical protein BJV82DRAFT_552016 [Fennellomyces sp. T-0311]
MTFDNKKKVLIVGGGLTGLALANVLKHQGVPFKVFERDASDVDRSQGFSLSLHFCLWSLKNAMDPVKYSTLGSTAAVDPENPRKSAFGLIDGNSGERKAVIEGPPNVDVFRVNRKRFRDWLMDGIDVEWDKQLDSYTVNDDGVQVTFMDGSTERGSILIGADGVNSRVCEQLIGSEEFEKLTVPNPLAVMASSYWISEEYRKEIAERFSPSHFIAIAADTDDSKFTTCLFVSLMDIDLSKDKPYQMLWSISCKHQGPVYETDAERVQQAKDWTRKAQFHRSLARLVEESPNDAPVYPIRIRERSPPAFLDTYRGPVILIGDAAHTMTQYRGEGANHGVHDAALLGMLIKDVYSGKKVLEDALNEYYSEMSPRGRKAVAESHEAAELFHGSRATVVGYINAAADRIREQAQKLKEEGKI